MANALLIVFVCIAYVIRKGKRHVCVFARPFARFGASSLCSVLFWQRPYARLKIASFAEMLGCGSSNQTRIAIKRQNAKLSCLERRPRASLNPYRATLFDYFLSQAPASQHSNECEPPT